VSLRNEIHPVPTATATVAEPSRKKSKMTDNMPIDSAAVIPDDFIELLYIIDNSVAIN
jgi:hypothetical protein